MIGWDAARELFFTRKVSLRKLAPMLGVSQRAVFRRTKAEQWTAKRQHLTQETADTVRAAALTRAEVLGAELAEQSAAGFKVRMGRTTALLANTGLTNWRPQALPARARCAR